MSCPVPGGCEEVRLLREGINKVGEHETSHYHALMLELKKQHGGSDPWHEPTDIRIDRGKSRRTRPVAWLALGIALLSAVPAWYAMLKNAPSRPTSVTMGTPRLSR